MHIVDDLFFIVAAVFTGKKEPLTPNYKDCEICHFIHHLSSPCVTATKGVLCSITTTGVVV